MFIGIDVSKDRLDVHVRPSGEAFTVARDSSGGLDRLTDRLRARRPELVVLEATGGFEITVAAALASPVPACRSPSSTRPRSAPSPAPSAGSPRPTGSTPS